MRRIFLVAAATAGLGGLAVAGQAQTPPPPAQPPAPPPEAMHRPPPAPMGGPMGGPGWMHRPGMDGPREMQAHAMWQRMRTFALLFRPADRQLSGADVQKIAEGFLLWNGNHTWKVTDVQEVDPDTVSFAIASPSGDVIARFTMNRHTGSVERTG